MYMIQSKLSSGRIATLMNESEAGIVPLRNNESCLTFVKTNLSPLFQYEEDAYVDQIKGC